MAVKARGERALALLHEADDPSESVDALEDALRETLVLVAHVLDVEAMKSELNDPTWRPLHRQEDTIYFSNDRGHTASLPAAVAAAFARGENLPGKTRIEDGVVEIELDDGAKASAPMSLIRALAPRRWPESDPRGAGA